MLPGTPVAQKALEMGLTTLEDHFTSKNPLTTLKVAWRLHHFLANFRPDNITCHRGEFFWFFALKHFLGKTGWSLIRVRGDERKPRANWLNRFLHNQCTDRIITSGHFIKQWFIDDLLVSPNKIDVIHGGVDTAKFAFDPEGRKRIRYEFGFEEDDIVVGLVGRYSSPKGHSVLLEALCLLRKQNSKYKLLLVSDNGSWDIIDLAAKINQQGLKGVAFVTGFRPDVVACMCAFDVGVVASVRSEAICRVAFELMAVGIPLVATTVGALPEIAPKSNLVPPNDATALANKIASADRSVKLFDDDAFLASYLESVSKACPQG